MHTSVLRNYSIIAALLRNRAPCSREICVATRFPLQCHTHPRATEVATIPLLFLITIFVLFHLTEFTDAHRVGVSAPLLRVYVFTATETAVYAAVAAIGGGVFAAAFCVGGVVEGEVIGEVKYGAEEGFQGREASAYDGDGTFHWCPDCGRDVGPGWVG